MYLIYNPILNALENKIMLKAKKFQSYSYLFLPLYSQIFWNGFYYYIYLITFMVPTCKNT